MIYFHEAVILREKEKTLSVPICHAAPAEFSGCRTLGEEREQLVLHKAAGLQRRRRKLRHEVKGDKERNVQGGWREHREAVSGQSD